MTDAAETPAREAPGAKPHPVIAGFELLERVGKGGMGAVYKARQVSVDRIVAVKVLRADFARNESFITRFKDEARAAAKLNHPNIVQAIDAGEEGGYYYFAMEFVDGETLHRQILRETAIEERRGLRIALDITHALAHAQYHGIVHRDIKPGNIMLSNSGVTKLCDLGLARLAEDDESGLRGAAVGTPYYISPEQASAQVNVDTRSDIYSLGATLYRAVVGRPAFDAPTKEEILAKHIRAPLPWPKDHNSNVSDGVCYLIAKMMAKKPSERYQTPDELAEDIERILAGEAPKSASVTLAMPPVRLSDEERRAAAMTTARLRRKAESMRRLAQVRDLVYRVCKEHNVSPQAVVRMLRGNMDETRPETFLKYGIILLAEGRDKASAARREFRQAALLGADTSPYMDKLDAMGAPPGMRYVPAGEFVSGPPDNAQTLNVPAFYIETNLITNAEYYKFLRSVPAARPPGHWLSREIPEGATAFPVVNITWDDAKAFADWKGRRLPTAAEWQKAARGTDGRTYPWGNEFDLLRCNTLESGIKDLTLAGRYPRGASPYGCLDMFGNVVQWCSDEGPTPDGEADGRAVCGVSWEEPGAPSGCWRVEFRKRIRRSRKCGFRCAMSL